MDERCLRLWNGTHASYTALRQKEITTSYWPRARGSVGLIWTNTSVLRAFWLDEAVAKANVRSKGGWPGVSQPNRPRGFQSHLPNSSDVQWLTLGNTHETPVVNGQLETLFAEDLPSGDYYLRLIVIKDSNYVGEPHTIRITVE